MTTTIPIDRLVRFNAAGPRYTSYPTAPTWRADLPESAWHEALAQAREPVSVYAHIPFCREQCWFCGCNMVVAGRRDAGDRYLDALQRQIDTLPLARPTLRAARVHLGGGTPTWLDPAQMQRLFALLDRRFPREPDAEVSVEIDPDVTSDAQLDDLVALGLTRISIGVQSFDPVVLQAIHRPQDPARIAALVRRAREHALRGLNLDLVYGLPHQSDDSMQDTLDQMLELRPDRLALYAFAHVPWLKAHQRRMDPASLPDPTARLRLFLAATDRLVAAGYVPVGMDHFALPDDELAIASRQRRLHRNFMGYTTRADLDVIGLGMSAISDVGGLYAQHQSHLAAWYRAVAGEGPLIEKAVVLSAEDRLRRDVIAELMCNFTVDVHAVERRHGICFAEHFDDALRHLAPLVDEGVVAVDDDTVSVTPVGRLLVRNVAMAFDGYLANQPDTSGGRGTFSRTL